MANDAAVKDKFQADAQRLDADRQAERDEEKQIENDRTSAKMMEGLRPVTVRFTASAWEAIRDTAEENGISQAELIRIAVAGNLNRYLGDIRIIDHEQGEEIKRLITALFDTISKIQIDLNRIGINFNQEIKLRQIERKYANTTGLGFDFNRSMRKAAEEKKVREESVNLSKEELEKLLERYEKATKQVGDILCRILT